MQCNASGCSVFCFFLLLMFFSFIANHGAQCAQDRVAMTLYAIKLFASADQKTYTVL